MRAKLNGYMAWHLSNRGVEDLAHWTPDDPEDFEVTFDFYACPEGQNTADAFTVRACSPKWFFRANDGDIVSAENTIFMNRFDGPKLIQYLEDRCAQTEGETWSAIAVQLTRLGRWEFDCSLKDPLS